MAIIKIPISKVNITLLPSMWGYVWVVKWGVNTNMDYGDILNFLRWWQNQYFVSKYIQISDKIFFFIAIGCEKKMPLKFFGCMMYGCLRWRNILSQKVSSMESR